MSNETISRFYSEIREKTNQAGALISSAQNAKSTDPESYLASAEALLASALSELRNRSKLTKEAKPQV